MSESVVGRRVAATRQNATGATAWPPGSVIGPGATIAAAVIVVFGGASDVSASHGVPAAAGEAVNNTYASTGTLAIGDRMYASGKLSGDFEGRPVITRR